MKLLLGMSLSFLLLFTAGCPAEPAGNTADTNSTTNSMENAGNTEMADNGDMGENSEKPMGSENKENPMVGGAPMSKEKDIVDNAANSKDHTTLVAAVKAAGLVETLKGEGPFTVFAPTNAAFEKLPEGTVDTLLKPENKDKLKGILTYHVVAGKLDAAAVADAIKKGDGKAVLKTVAGGEITISMDGDKVVITDAKGGKSTVAIADVYQSNGVIHVVDTVLMPE
ncbi:MAG: fasciclin domain-containing protein [Pyrinomonadaceae bacterium]